MSVSRATRIPRAQRRAQHAYEGGAPLRLTDELERLLAVYRAYPGIASDLRRALADLEQGEDGAA